MIKCEECGCKTVGGYAYYENGVRLPICIGCGLIQRGDISLREWFSYYTNNNHLIKLQRTI